MATKTFVADGGGNYHQLIRLHAYDGAAWQQLTKLFECDGVSWNQIYQVPQITGISVSRDACTDNSGHIVGWTVVGDLPGWTVLIERNINSAGWTTVGSGLDPVTDNPTSVAYASGNSRTETAFRVSLVYGPLTALGSPVTKNPPITPC